MKAMKTIILLLISVSMSASAFAGTYAKTPKNPVMPPAGCECFSPGFAVGFFGGGDIYAHSRPEADNGLGGGVLVEYFFNEYLGFQASYGAFSTSPVHHNYEGDLILRYPIKSLCIAPYLMAGGGGDANGTNRGTWNAGGGIEARFENLHCMAIFADGAYHWAGDSRDNDYTIVRLGVKFPF